MITAKEALFNSKLNYAREDEVDALNRIMRKIDKYSKMGIRSF